MTSSDERRRRWQRRQLRRQFEDGAVLTASSAVPGRADVHQGVALSRSADGGARVQIEYYRAGDWDGTLRQVEHCAPDLETALNWLEVECGIQWAQLRGLQ